MITIVSSTNRPDSITRAIADLYASMLQERGQQCQILDLATLPIDFTSTALYDNAGKNDKFNQLSSMLSSSEKLVFIVPEYNNSYPGVLKAFIDGLAYPAPFKNKKAAMVGLSAGIQGSGMAMSHLTDVFNYLGMHVLALKPRLAHITKNFDGKKITNKAYQDLLEEQLEQFISF